MGDLAEDNQFLNIAIRYARPLLVKRLHAEVVGTVFRMTLSEPPHSRFKMIGEVLRPKPKAVGSFGLWGHQPSSLKFEPDGGCLDDGDVSNDGVVSAIWRQDGLNTSASDTSMRLGKHMFFSVVHKRLPNPAFYAPHAAGTTIESVLPTTAMAIASHDMVVADQHHHMAYVTRGSGTQAFGAMDAQALFSASAFNLRELESLRRAAPKPELHYFIEPDPDSKLMPQEFAAMRFVLGAMMQAKAKPAGDADGALYIVHANQTGRAANLKALSELQRMGCVEQVGADGQQRSWRFTYLDMSRLVLCTAVPFGNHACKQLLSVRRDVPLRDLNEYELLVMTKEVGWFMRISRGVH